MRLSKNFVLSEITRSNTAKRLGISNEPKKEHLKNLQRIITDIIQPMRDALGPIRISSGYRSPSLNRAISGSNKSQHTKGQALDLQFWKEGKMCNKEVYDWVLENDVEFDQMINEFDFSWVHLSLRESKNRKQVLIAYKDEDNDTKYKYAPEDLPNI
ncbi:MAG: peptidase M15 [Phycisphaerae bacterium]|nr:peptidase M15 [Phycisphaerae bacterium]|tara:strand:- start:203 stop:673 length:471 start_codon:yes stop_codon:yes gene_type:complete